MAYIPAWLLNYIAYKSNVNRSVILITRALVANIRDTLINKIFPKSTAFILKHMISKPIVEV